MIEISINLQSVIHNWFDYESEDEKNRPIKIEQWVKNYKNGTWLVGRKKC